MVNKFWLLFLVICTTPFGPDQEQIHQISILVTIDNNSIVSLTNVTIKTETEIFTAKYNLGHLIVNELDLIKLEKSKNIILSFESKSNCSILPERRYLIELESILLIQDYLWLKIFNYELYPNVFGQNTGYGYEYVSPIHTSKIPTKPGMGDCIESKNICW